MDEIKQCPFCGGEAFINSRYSHGWFVFVKCDICGAQGKRYNSPEDPTDGWDNSACESAVAAWNMRKGE